MKNQTTNSIRLSLSLGAIVMTLGINSPSVDFQETLPFGINSPSVDFQETLPFGINGPSVDF